MCHRRTWTFSCGHQSKHWMEEGLHTTTSFLTTKEGHIRHEVKIIGPSCPDYKVTDFGRVKDKCQACIDQEKKIVERMAKDT